MKNSIKYSLIYSLLLVTINIFAQADTTYLPGETVNVVKDFKAKIGSANAINSLPKPPSDQDHQPLNLTYDLAKKEYDIEYPDPVIKPIPYNETVKDDFKNGYVKAGYGNLNSPFLEGQFNYLISDWFDAGIDVKHLSANGEAHPLQEISDTYIQLYGGYYHKENTKIGAKVNFQTTERNYYSTVGFIEQDSSLTNRINDYNIGLSFDHNAFDKSNFSSFNTLNFGITDHTRESEQSIVLSSKNNFKIFNPFSLSLDGHIDAYTIRSEINQSGFIFNALPTLNYDNNKLNISIGALFANPKKFWVGPSARFRYNLDQLPMSITADIKSHVDRNGVRNITQDNPWALLGSDTLSFHKTMTFSIGAELHNAKHRLAFQAGYEIHNDAAIYNNARIDTFALSHFTIAPQDYKAIVLSLRGNYKILSKIDIAPSITYNHVINKKEKSIYYIPSLTGQLRITENIFNNKLNIFQQIAFGSRQTFLDNNDSENEINGFFDLAIGAEYMIKDPFGIFIQANNILNKSYQQYYGYPVIGINFHAGIKLLF